MKKRKILKTISLASLAVVIGAAGIFAFAPIGASASEPRATTTTGLGLDPKNDPVVYTTQTGLEIRMSGSTQISGTSTVKPIYKGSATTYTQDLSGFYYFTMGTYSGTIYTCAGNSTTASYVCTNTPVNWIILGLGANTGYFLDEVTKNLFSTWKENNNGYINSNGASGSYFFSEIYETYSPAGQLIDSVVAAKTYIMDKVKALIPQDPANEIPEGCMLVISEKLLGQMYVNSAGAINQNTTDGTNDWARIASNASSYNYGDRYRYRGNSSTKSTQSWTNKIDGSLYSYINSLFSKNNSTGAIISNSLGFTQAQANLIVPQQLYTYYTNYGGYHYQDSPETDGNTFYSMFPLATREAYSSIYQNFCFEDYLPNQNQKIAVLIGSPTNQSYPWWTRSGMYYAYCSCNYLIRPNGETPCSWWSGNSLGVRPAMVMKLQ